MHIPNHLVYVNDDMEGYTRKKRGDKFSYFFRSEPLKNSNELKRIESLVIPPMWQHVWICSTCKGHLQATGKDLKNRKQYIYHSDWTSYQQKKKFSRLLPFGKKLSLIREKVSLDLKKKGWPKEKVLALAIRLLDDYYLRIGNLQYKKRNETFGLTTLRRKHLDFVDHGQLKLSYKAKSNKHRNISITNKKLVNLLKSTAELPGYEVFRYLDEHKKSNPIDSSDVNTYLHEISGEHFTAKDFRTWAGTKMTLEYREDAQLITMENPKKKFESTLVKLVAKKLGNTMAVCREYYIHPQILKTVENEKVYNQYHSNVSFSHELLDESESLVLSILEDLNG